MKTSKFLKALSVNLLIAVALAAATEIDFLYCFGFTTICGAAMYQVNKQYGIAAFDGLATEIWLPDVMEDFYPKNHFLTAARDLSSLVDHDKINFAEAGADPTVMKNNTTYPITANVATDTPKEVTLDYYDTDSSIVRNAIAVELAYDQRQLYTKKHQKALLKRLGQDGAYAYAPASDAATTPVLSLAVGDSFIDAVIDLQAKYNAFDDDGTDRNLILAPSHMAKIAKEDKTLYKAMLAEPGNIYFGFRIWNYSKNPIYVAATSVKAAFGAAYVGGTHKYGSVAFLGSEVMKAQGTFKMFSTLNDPAQKVMCSTSRCVDW